MSESLPKGTKTKIVDFKDQGYSISGCFLKNRPVENTIMEISDAYGFSILYGTYRIIDGKSAIYGRCNYESEGRKISLYGMFYVNNGFDELIMKPRKASELIVTDYEVDIWSGFYNECRAELSCITDKSPLLHIFSNSDENELWPYRLFRAEVSPSAVSIRDYKNLDIEALLLSDTLKVEIEWQNNTRFTGYALGKRGDKGYVYFTLLNGEKIDKTGQKNIVSLHSQWGALAKYTLTVANPNGSETSFYLPYMIKDVSLDSLYHERYYWNKSPEISVTYSNGDRYLGSYKLENGNAVNTVGTYTYAGGDMFVGDLSGERFVTFPIAGKTIFKDGTEKEGNWLKEYKLTNLQYLSVCKGNHAPSDIRNAAQSLYNENKAASLVNQAELSEKSGDFKKAKELYLQSQSYKYSSLVDSKLKEIEDKVKRQELVEKYGSRYADNILNGKIQVGMTKEMCELVLSKTVGMDFYRKSSWEDFGGNRIETWEYDFEYGVKNAKSELYKDTVGRLGKDGEKASNGEKVATALLSEAIMGFAKTITSPFADTMTEYKYLKFKNSRLVELNDMSDNQKKTENTRSILDWLF